MSLVPVTNLIGMGFTVPHGTVPLVIPFPQKGNGILFLCGFIFAIIIIIGVVVVVVVRQWSNFAHFSRYLNETWWAHGPWA